ncbi:hypothetical protein ACMYSQ_012395 [Aspergillus niger]
MTGKSSAALTCLPTEILQQILSYLPTEDLSQNVQWTCTKLRDVTCLVYRTRYGKGPAPVSENVDDWKTFAIQYEEVYLKDTNELKEQTIDAFLESYFEYPDETLTDEARDIIYYLHESPQEHPRGFEAIVAALSVQNRYLDASEYLKTSANLLTLDSKALLQARFNLKLSVAWHECSIELLNQSLSATATIGNLNGFRYIVELVLAKDGEVDYIRAATAAARSGILEIFEYIHAGCGNVLNSADLALLMDMSIRYGCANITESLLETCVLEGIQAHYESALRFGHVEILLQFAKYKPGVAATYMESGDLQLSFVLSHGEKKCKTIYFLAKHASVDIDAIGRDGLTAAHVAAEKGLFEELELLLSLGASLTSCGLIEQTAAELVYCSHKHSIAHQTFSPGLIDRKKDLARHVLKMSRGENIRALSTKCREEVSGIESAYDDAEAKLVALWARNIGMQTLEQLHKMLETPVVLNPGPAKRAGEAKELAFLNRFDRA